MPPEVVNYPPQDAALPPADAEDWSWSLAFWCNAAAASWRPPWPRPIPYPDSMLPPPQEPGFEVWRAIAEPTAWSDSSCRGGPVRFCGYWERSRDARVILSHHGINRGHGAERVPALRSVEDATYREIEARDLWEHFRLGADRWWAEANGDAAIVVVEDTRTPEDSGFLVERPYNPIPESARPFRVCTSSDILV